MGDAHGDQVPPKVHDGMLAEMTGSSAAVNAAKPGAGESPGVNSLPDDGAGPESPVPRGSHTSMVESFTVDSVIAKVGSQANRPKGSFDNQSVTSWVNSSAGSFRNAPSEDSFRATEMRNRFVSKYQTSKDAALHQSSEFAGCCPGPSQPLAVNSRLLVAESFRCSRFTRPIPAAGHFIIGDSPCCITGRKISSYRTSNENLWRRVFVRWSIFPVVLLMVPPSPLPCAHRIRRAAGPYGNSMPLGTDGNNSCCCLSLPLAGDCRGENRRLAVYRPGPAEGANHQLPDTKLPHAALRPG